MDKKIAVVVPVLNRPARILPLVKSFRESCSPEQASLYIVAQRDDEPELRELQVQAQAHPTLFNGLTLLAVMPENRSWAKKVNIALAKTKEPWLLLVGDDVNFKPGWIESLLPLMDKPCVIGIRDPEHEITDNVAAAHFLVSREYALCQGTIDGQPVIAHEGYDHNFVDHEIALTAFKRGSYRFAADCREIEHLHPLNGTAKIDSTYRRGSLNYHEDEALFRARSKQYGLEAAWGEVMVDSRARTKNAWVEWTQEDVENELRESRKLESSQQESAMKTRIDVINHLIAVKGYESYLEIGCQDDVCFKEVTAEHKVGVDPFRGGTHRMTSDTFFARNEECFDLIFIDGDHAHGQAIKDVMNALQWLAPGGTIVMHDCLPPDAEHESVRLCGTAWRAFASMREYQGLVAITADFDYGVGIIRRGVNPDPVEVPALDDLTFADFIANRERWMRPRNAEQVKAFIEGRDE